MHLTYMQVGFPAYAFVQFLKKLMSEDSDFLMDDWLGGGFDGNTVCLSCQKNPWFVGCGTSNTCSVSGIGHQAVVDILGVCYALKLTWELSFDWKNENEYA